ncbi:MAG TPA: hypothetical protein DEO54_10115 [Rikenellaceae bacterium]|jgi:hypothetical protein|nr:MAG: hypothetical protein A2X20_10805 [Bacteroidetes bacterium GWE2_40_15]PKP07288.1 MAG: hypothetical protein CVU10_07025 [Bacteroidetes bacterium HGW-Bacteroidetes-5]HBZ26568.1 hypothetical protein [Rikenellaceae bacterium]
MEINLKSVFTTGLVAGLVISLSAISMVPVVGNEMDVVLAIRGLPPLSNLAYGFMPVKLTVIGTIWGLGELLLAGIVGSRLYKEKKIA